MKKVISILTLVVVLLGMMPCLAFAEGESDANDVYATLGVLDISTGSGGKQNFNENNLCTKNPGELSDDHYDYNFASSGGNVYVNIMALPKNTDASVEVYATIANGSENFPKRFYDAFTGQVKPAATKKTYKGSKEKYTWYDSRTLSGYNTSTFRIVVKEANVENTYNIYLAASNSVDPLTDIKTGFTYTADVLTDVSTFISPAKALIETAKPIYKARMDAATDAMEACKIANEFNIIVCQAKAIEDEYTVLNDKVTDAKDALSGISEAVKTSANEAVTAAETLDLTEYSEEDAAAITEALDELKGELADETATPESILEKKSALDDAVNTAKLNAVKASEEATQIELDKAKEDLDKAATENDALKDQIKDLTKAKEDAEAKLDDTEKKLDETKEKLAKAEKALIDDAAGKVVASAEKYIDAAKADLEKAAQAIAENAGAFAEDTAKKFFAKAAEAIKAATKGLEQVNGTLAEGSGRIEDLKSQLSELSETIKAGVASEAELASLNKQLEEAKDELEQAKADLAKNEGISSELEQLKAELEKANAELAKATKPEQVTANSAKAGKKKVTVKWTALDGAEGYVVYRSLKKNKGFKAVKTIKKAKTVKFTDKKVKKGKKYFYKVRAYKMYDGNKLFGAYSKVLKTAKVK